jgi:DNA-binding transcriptional LysR family regulator
MDQLYMLRAFVAAAQQRSFSKAAAALGVTTGSISKAVAKLEASLGTRILHRTTRSVTLTESAEAYYRSCSRLLAELDEANRRIAGEHRTDGGKLRLIVHPAVVAEPFSTFLSSYRRRAPHVNLMMSVRSGRVDLYDGECDVAIVPPPMVEQSAVIRRTLWKSLRIFVASPSYVRDHGSPTCAADLSRHALLVDPGLRRPGSDEIELLEDGTRVTVAPAASIDGDELFVRTAALAGAGIAALAQATVYEDVAQGRLVAMLPRCTSTGGEVEMCLFYSHRELLPARTRTFVDHCTEFFRIKRGVTRWTYCEA